MGNFAGLPRRAIEGGQGKTEYVIIIALIVIAAIGAYSFFGQPARQQDAGVPARQQDAGVVEKDPPGKMATKNGAGDQGGTSQVPAKPGEPKAAEEPKSVDAPK